MPLLVVVGGVLDTVVGVVVSMVGVVPGVVAAPVVGVELVFVVDEC